MKRLIAMSSLACMACATVEAQNPDNPTLGPGEASCSIERLGPLVGRARSDALGAQARRWSGAGQLRWIRPGDAVTMDYRTDRLNIHLDAQGRVDHFSCG